MASCSLGRDRREHCELLAVVLKHSEWLFVVPIQLISVISLLSQDVPDLNSPANVDAAKQVRDDFEGACWQCITA
jgi:ubiquitin-protein ligase